jgi:hypothetical protein
MACEPDLTPIITRRDHHLAGAGVGVKRVCVVLVLAVVATGRRQNAPPTTASTLVLQPLPTPFPTVSMRAHCLYGTAANGEPLPDATRTPGALNHDVTSATIATKICTTGWTETVRPPEAYTGTLKRRMMLAYGTTTPAARTELDYLIPLEPGGAPWDPRNLWPEPSDDPTGAG